MLPCYPTDTVGEFTPAAGQPESGQDGVSREVDSPASGSPDEFANSIPLLSEAQLQPDTEKEMKIVQVVLA
jgi:hypothetical protein